MVGFGYVGEVVFVGDVFVLGVGGVEYGVGEFGG